MQILEARDDFVGDTESEHRREQHATDRERSAQIQIQPLRIEKIFVDLRVFDDDGANDRAVALCVVLPQRNDELLRAVYMKVILLDEGSDFSIAHRRCDFVAAIVGEYLADLALVRIRDSALVTIDDDDVTFENRIQSLDVGLEQFGPAIHLVGGCKGDQVGEVLGFEEGGALDPFELQDEHRHDARRDDERKRREGGAEFEPKADELLERHEAGPLSKRGMVSS
ncbi:MAG: hypothetical protein DMG78_29425 [Acidobacteria bacterium]|nr:MAG: hypothetical protein DMG78_29425 [Acidobacteriota bacterium]